MRLTLLAAAAALLPTLAPAEFLRDSDGDVISVIRYYRDSDGLVWAATGGGIEPYYRFDFEEDSGGPTAIPASTPAGTQVQIGGSTFRVESAESVLWLRDTATGARIKGRQMAARPDAAGRKVNPRGFGLD